MTRATLVVAATLLAAGCKDNRPRPVPEFNQRVLALTAGYPAGGFGGYAWPARNGGQGPTRDLAVAGEVVARGGDGNHCVGVTLEVYWRALEQCAGGTRAAFDPAAARDFKSRWYVPALHGLGVADALPAHHLGQRVPVEAALPGDFVQAWTPEGQGHSMVFLGWRRDATGRIVAIRYWSSQPWTDGIAITESEVGGPGHFDPAEIYVARASCPRS